MYNFTNAFSHLVKDSDDEEDENVTQQPSASSHVVAEPKLPQDNDINTKPKSDMLEVEILSSGSTTPALTPPLSPIPDYDPGEVITLYSSASSSPLSPPSPKEDVESDIITLKLQDGNRKTSKSFG